MKSTTPHIRCIPGTGFQSAGRTRSHTPPRYGVGAARQPAFGPDQPMYFEELGQSSPAAVRQSGVLTASSPRVLHIDADMTAARVLSTLLAPEASVTHAATLAEARQHLAGAVFSLVVLDPALPDGDARTLLPLLAGTPLLVHAALQPDWRGASPVYLAKPWASARQLWVAISSLLGVSSTLTAGD